MKSIKIIFYQLKSKSNGKKEAPMAQQKWNVANFTNGIYILNAIDEREMFKELKW